MNDVLVDLVLILNPWADQTDGNCWDTMVC